MFQVGEGRREESQLGCGMNHFLITERPFPFWSVIWHVALPVLLHQEDRQGYIGRQQ